MNTINYVFLMLFLVCVSNLCIAQTSLEEIYDTELREGDLIFQNKSCGALCDAINKVTPSIHGRHFSHMGVLAFGEGGWTVLEATYPQVQEIPLADFLAKSKETHWIGRLDDTYAHLHTDAVLFARAKIGTNYDLDYLYDNNAYYCSELVYDAYLYANKNTPVFALEPMTFKDPDTGKLFKNWIDFYEKRQIAIPEGELGCNPGGLANFKGLTLYEFVY